VTIKILAATSLAALFASGALAQSELAPGETLADEQTFAFRLIDELPTLDPNLIEDVYAGDVARQLFEGLLNQDAQGNPIPGVATDWTVSEDELVYTFNLRPEAKWSDGTPVTANDFVYSWRRTADPATASPYSWYLELMQLKNAGPVITGEVPPDQLGVRAVDDHTLEVTLEAPVPYLPQMVTHTTTHPVPRPAIEAHGAQWTQPGKMVSNGAYVLSERVPQERTVLTRNEQYWDNANTTLDTVTFLVINDDNQALTRWEVGELDRTETPFGQYPELTQEYPGEALALPMLCVAYYAVNVREDAPAALQDVRVRQALNLAIDRDIITRDILASGEEPAYTLTPTATAGWEVPSVPAAEMTQEERNAEAQRLLQEAGYGAGGEPLTLEILYNTSPDLERLNVAVGQMWKQTLGVETTLTNMEWQTYLEAHRSGEFELSNAGWCADYNEASSFLDILTSNSEANASQYRSAEYDALMEQSRTAEDPLPLHQQAEQLLAQDVPILPINFFVSSVMLNDAIKGWPVENAQQLWYAKDLYRIAED
jgi:oligopeptide transport system substrate-binding protein